MGRDVGAIVPAAGRGVRLQRRRSKAFVLVAGKPLVLHALRALQESPAIRWVVVVVQPSDRARLARLVRAHRLTKVCAIAPGASSRAGSVARGLAALPAEARWVVIHDGARPCVTRALIEQAVARAKRCGGVACGVPASVTVKAVDPDRGVRLTLDREQLWFVQTPQVFRRDWLEDALARVRGPLEQFSDDAALLEWAGFPVRMVPGDALNIKVTTPADLVLAEAILRNGTRSHHARRHRV